jgi:hypothetical protein
MSERIAKKMREEATAHELKAGEMLRCARRLQKLAKRHQELATGLWRAQHALLGEKKRVGRPRKTTITEAQAARIWPCAWKKGTTRRAA